MGKVGVPPERPEHQYPLARPVLPAVHPPLEGMKAARHCGRLMQAVCAVRRKVGATFMDVPLLLQEASGQLGESRSFAEKGHFRSGWICSPISIPGPPWEPGLTHPLFPADRLRVREVSGFRNSNWMSLTPSSFLPGHGPRRHM